MTTRKILTVGLELASSETTYAKFRAKTSLLDWDIFLFRPEISEFLHSYYETFQGKPCFNDTASLRLESVANTGEGKSSRHLRRERPSSFSCPLCTKHT